MLRTMVITCAALSLSGCAVYRTFEQQIRDTAWEDPVVDRAVYLSRPDNSVPPPRDGAIPVAVYSYGDRTGQRKSLPNVASLSSAVTQGADSYLIKALQDVGGGEWFIPVERVGLDNLIKERQMIRQAREGADGREAKPLPPLLFAGIIMEGGIIGYDSNTTTGGSGARLLGIGASTQYQSDTVTVNLRTVSVSTGQVLINVTVTKTVLSYMDKMGVLNWVREGTSAVEVETGMSVNESINKAIEVAIQAAVVDTIREGARRGHWHYKEDVK